VSPRSFICFVRAKLQAVYKKFKNAQIHPHTSDVELGHTWEG
jgi:hypothetical protein